jgi:hypothetical protein
MNNIVKGPYTTFLGLIIIGAALVSVFTNQVTWTEAAIGITLGTGFMFAPDPKSKK